MLASIRPLRVTRASSQDHEASERFDATPAPTRWRNHISNFVLCEKIIRIHDIISSLSYSSHYTAEEILGERILKIYAASLGVCFRHPLLTPTRFCANK
jgi:hypothetical protein